MLRSLFILTFTAQFLCLLKCFLGYNCIIDNKDYSDRIISLERGFRVIGRVL